MNGRFLLDTNIVIAIMRGEEAITRRLVPAMRLYLSSVVVGELFYGAYRSVHVRDNIARVQVLARDLPVLACDLGTADCYGELKHELRKKGRPVPDNDIWLAATSHQHKLGLITRDQHFRQFTSLNVDFW